MPGISKKILIVDDDQIFCKLISRALEDAGFETQTAFNGEDGLEIATTERPQMILLDLAMPGIDGFQVASEIRKSEPEGTHVTIVMMTAYARSFFAAVEFDAGIDSYLTKPMLPDAVVDHVKSLVP
jgi:two-component system alkaline phosphatase synthesis response regulator PhoP